jgi:membrane-bound lytic murein transglycosylase D
MIQSWCKLIFSLFIGTFFVAINSFALPSLEGIQVYQKNIHLSEERKQSLADDIDRYRNADNMWDVLRAEFTLPHYEDNPLVQEQINWFLNNQEFLQRAASRAAPYLYYISQQVRKRHLPAEVVLLPMIESAYNPFVYSSAGAGGIWQMMPDTATGYGVKQNWWYDGRRDIVASTKAALDYLVYLGGFFDGNWLLAIAAYNTGEGNVLAAIRRNVRDNRNTDFWSLPVHQQTREYVPRLLALASIIAHSDKYSLTFPGVNNAPYLAQIDMGGQIDLSYAAKLAGLSLRDLKQLNPGYNRATTDPSGPFKIVLPIENVAQFSENLLRTPSDERVHWNHYKVRNGDTLVAIARKFKTTADTLSKMNSLKTAQLKPGVQLIVPQSIPDISQTILDSEKRLVTARNTKPPVKSVQAIKTALVEKTVRGTYTLQPGDTLYVVRSNDTLQKVASRFHINLKTLLAANNYKSVRPLSIGTQLVIPTHFNKIEKYQISPGDTVYMVRSGDTLDRIAQKFHTSTPAIRIANLMSNNKIQEGDRLVIPTHG